MLSYAECVDTKVMAHLTNLQTVRPLLPYETSYNHKEKFLSGWIEVSIFNQVTYRTRAVVYVCAESENSYDVHSLEIVLRQNVREEGRSRHWQQYPRQDFTSRVTHLRDYQSTLSIKMTIFLILYNGKNFDAITPHVKGNYNYTYIGEYCSNGEVYNPRIFVEYIARRVSDPEGCDNQE